MAGLSLGDPVIEGLPLVGNDDITHQLLILTQKRIVNFQFVQIDLHDFSLRLNVTCAQIDCYTRHHGIVELAGADSEGQQQMEQRGQQGFHRRDPR